MLLSWLTRGTVPCVTPVLRSPVLSFPCVIFSYGALAFDFVAIVVAPFLNVDLEPIEWDSVSVDNTNSTPVYGVYE